MGSSRQTGSYPGLAFIPMRPSPCIAAGSFGQSRESIAGPIAVFDI